MRINGVDASLTCPAPSDDYISHSELDGRMRTFSFLNCIAYITY